MLTKSDGVVYGNGRWCQSCGHDHGTLYYCPDYPAEVRDEILRLSEKHRQNLSDPEWCARQVEKGLPPEGIEIFKALAGL